MKEFDYVIIGGGCAGLSLAYELEISNKLKDKTLAIIELREEYKRDKTWSFWKVFDHSFEDCVIKSWNNFTINTSEGSQELKNDKYPYQSINSGKFYEKINLKLSKNPNVNFFKNLDEIKSENSAELSSIKNTIIKILETKVRPAVARDGGDIKFKDFKDGKVTVELQGSCSGCPSSTLTLKKGVQNLLCHYVPEVKEVEAI